MLIIVIIGIICFFVLAQTFTFSSANQRAATFKEELNKVFARVLNGGQVISKPSQLKSTDSLATVMFRKGFMDNTISGEFADTPVSIQWYLGKINLVFIIRIPVNDPSEMEFTQHNRPDLLQSLSSVTQRNVLNIFENGFVNRITFKDRSLTLQLDSFGPNLLDGPNVLCDGGVSSWSFVPADEAADNIKNALKNAIELARNFPN